LMAMMLSDLVIGWHDLVFITWGSYALIALVGSHWLQKLSVRRIFALGVGSSVFFFIVTNFAVWITSGMYAHTLAGLQQCFVMALPFFRNTLLSDVLYSGILFGLYELATKSYKSEVAKPA